MPPDIRPVRAELHFLPIRTRMPLKFGPEVTTEVTCARVKLTVVDRHGRSAEGWGETPLSVQWVWPSDLPYEERHQALKNFCTRLARLWTDRDREFGHPMEIGHELLTGPLPAECADFNARHRPGVEPMPWLAALVCSSPFDLALHDAYGVLHGVPTYQTYTAEWMARDLSAYLRPAEDTEADASTDAGAGAHAPAGFAGKYPADFLRFPRAEALRAWHLVGGKDPIDEFDLTGAEPDDGEPVLLRDWIARDGLKCLKVKLTGTDDAWDYDRLLRVGRLAIDHGVDWLTADFNCTVREPEYVNAILDRLLWEQPRIYGMLLYVEQPFPYDLETNRIDVRSVSARKPLFMDESAHGWEQIRLGRALGWSGVALKTCKTQTGALLSLCWARAHGMTLMVQDLTNPMLAQVPHALLAAHAGTIMGVETNSMQFYPAASRPEAAVHPGLYRRRDGEIRLDSLRGPGFGYRIDEIRRTLLEPAVVAGS